MKWSHRFIHTKGVPSGVYPASFSHNIGSGYNDLLFNASLGISFADHSRKHSRLLKTVQEGVVKRHTSPEKVALESCTEERHV